MDTQGAAQDLLSIYEQHHGKVSDKWSSYIKLYNLIFNRFRNQPVRILEIGIQNGGSLEIWSKFFPNAAVIIGCDINERCRELKYDDPRISVIVGDANDPEIIAKVGAISDRFDIIIDDGSHMSDDIVRSFALYFPKLSVGGLYVAEDLHCSYWGGFKGGIEAPYSSIAFFKRLADYVNREHWGANVAASTMVSYFSDFWGVEFGDEPLELIDEVTFRNSVVIVSKGAEGQNLLGERVVFGEIALVESKVQNLMGVHEVAPDQSLNGYGPLADRAEAVISQIQTGELAAMRALLETQKADIETLAKQLEHSSDIQTMLVMSRRRPLKLVGDLIQFKLLRSLAKSHLPIPTRMRDRFAKSAAKRDPRRPFNAAEVFGGLKFRRTVVPVASIQLQMLQEVSTRFASPGSSVATLGEDGPKFSILLPTYNTPEALLRRCLDTVLFQTWSNWELLISDDGSTADHVWRVLQDYMTRDRRIKAVRMSENGGISKASQAALERAEGTYTALLDHDDELTCDALEKMAQALVADPEIGIAYSDECKLDPDGMPLEIYAKPDWSPALMINCMYIGHLTVYRTELIHQVGGFRSEFDFSQDYDLALRVSEKGIKVHHIPEVLYGWRMIAESAASGGKPYARNSNIAALQEAANRRGWSATAIAKTHGNALEWHVSSGEVSPLVSLVIPSDNEKMITEAIASINTKSSYRSFEILVVTNSQLIAKLNKQQNWPKSVQFVPYDKAFNFSDKCNVGAAAAKGDFIVLYNDDVRVLSADWIERILDVIRIEGVGAVGPKLLYEDGTLQHAGMVTGVRRLVGTAFHTLPKDTGAYFNYANSLREVSLLCGALIALRTDTFRQIGGFDAANVPIYHSDVDLCLKVQELGQRCIYTPHTELLHIGHVSIGTEEKKVKKIRKDKAGVWMLRRWPQEIANDPYFPEPMRKLCYHDSPDPFKIFPGAVNTKQGKGDVLLISHDLSGSGAPRVVLEMARALQSEGWFVVVAAPSDGKMRQEFEALGVSVVIDSLLMERHDSVRDFAKDYDLVIANTVVCWPLIDQLQGIVPTIWYVHEIELVDHLVQEHHDFNRVIAQAPTVIAGSELCAKNLRRLRKKVEVLEYGVPRILPVIAAQSVARPLRIGVFASFEHRKGQDLIIEAFAGLDEKERIGAALHLYGRVLDEAMKQCVFAKFGNTPGLVFHGELNHEHYIDALSESDLVVIPSRNDTLPLVSLDALSAGVPLLCTATTGTSAYLQDGVSGFIASDATVQSLRNALTSALKARQDWVQIAQAGQTVFAKKFSQEAFRNRLSQMATSLAAEV